MDSELPVNSGDRENWTLAQSANKRSAHLPRSVSEYSDSLLAPSG